MRPTALILGLLLAATALEAQDGKAKWLAGFNTGGSIVASPAVGPDGTIYVGSESRRLFAINPNRTTKWTYPAASVLLPPTDWFDSSPAIAADGTVYAGNFDGRLYALNANGTLRWSYPTNSYILSSPAIGSDGTVYFGAGDGALRALTPEGMLKWEFQTADWIDSSPAIGGDGTIYFGSWDDRVYALNPDGTLKWSVLTEGAVQSSPAIGPDGTIYIGSADKHLWAIRADGTVAWKFLTGDSVDGHPAVGPDGRIYFGSTSGRFYALNPDGMPAWAAPYDAGQGVFGGVTIRADGTLLFGASDRRLHAVKADGSALWTFTTGDIVDSTPAIAPDGTIYFGSYDNRLYALNGSGSPLATAPWPTFHRDLVNHGRAPATAPLTAPVILVPPASLSVAYGASATFSVQAAGSAPLTFQWRKGGVAIPGANASSYTIEQAVSADAGGYAVRVVNAAGEALSATATLTVAAPIAPAITLQPRGLTLQPGNRLSLWVDASGSAPLSYQWRKDNLPIPGEVGRFHEAAAASAADAGSYSVMVTNAAGAVTSATASVVLDAGASSVLGNLSTRAMVGAGDSILIPGFVISGSAPRRLLIRAVGPTLATAPFNVSGALLDPALSIFSGGTMLFTNNDWSSATNAGAIADAAASVGAFALPAASGDAAALVDLAPGPYTVQVSGVGGATGIALVEVYDATAPAAATGRLANLAARSETGSGDAIAISGFVVTGTAAKTLLVRAVGPSLASFGVGGRLADPRLVLFNGAVQIFTNDDWNDAPDVAALIAATSSVGAFPLEADSADSAALVVLMPGSYTAQAIGADGGAGNVLVEVYDVQ